MPEADDSPRDVFARIYDTAHWEGGSGQGSRADVTGPYRRVVETIIGAGDVRSVVDAGCGDWEFSHLVDWSPVEYVGVDVVPSVVEADRERYGRAGVRFEQLDFSVEAPPPADLLLCKDVLQHWPLALVSSFLARIEGRYRYALLTNDLTSVHCPPEAVNTDIAIGAWRTLDLEAAPFGLEPAWRFDYDIRGEWTKRALLLVAPRHRLRARLTPGSALRRARGLAP